MSSTVFAARSRRKTSKSWLRSLGTRLASGDSKAIELPSALIRGTVDGDRDADPVRIRVQQGRDSRLNIAKIQMVLAGKRIGNEIRTAAKEGNKSTRGVYRRPVESRVGGNCIAEVGADEKVRSGPGIPEVDGCSSAEV